MALLRRAKRYVRRQAQYLRNQADYSRYRLLAMRYNIRGYRRIYHIHIRKTGGTSLNLTFMNTFHPISEDPVAELALKRNYTFVREGKVFTGWSVPNINRGAYFYAFSHTPLFALDLKPDTFTYTCFRDPLRRLVSHYNMLMDYRINSVDHPCMITEGPWLGDSFDDFLDNIPREHLQNQLYMYSPTFDVDDALATLATVTQVCYTEQMDASVAALADKTGLPLKMYYTHRSGYRAEISDAGLERAREMLAEEYAFMARVLERYPL